MELPKRKSVRLKGFDYNSNGAYFITICTHKRKCILSNIVGDGVYDIPQIHLSEYGKILNKYIQIMNSKYENVSIDKYIIMPNHIHLIIKITRSSESGLSQAPNPTNSIIPKFISLFKRYCNREIGQNMFQRSFHDHIIRDEKDYLKIWNYIDTNPQKWKKDMFYIE
ncbi:MAG: transposase [Clostridia bacterium]|nr:transposase [Clostridia bacterium]